MITAIDATTGMSCCRPTEALLPFSCLTTTPFSDNVYGQTCGPEAAHNYYYLAASTGQFVRRHDPSELQSAALPIFLGHCDIKHYQIRAFVFQPFQCFARRTDACRFRRRGIEGE